MPPNLSGAAADRALRDRALGAAAWTEMQRLGIVPTPRAYDLWFTHLGGASAALTERVVAMLAQGGGLPPAALDALHSEFVAPAEPDVDGLSEGADELQAEAKAMTAAVAAGQVAMTGYGEILSHWATQLNQQTSMAELVGAVGSLTVETVRAVERSRALEQQLTVSTARIGRLRRTLADAKQEATTDLLTGIANRKAFDSRLRRAVQAAKAEPGAVTSILLLDIDHFKRFNDTFGHRTGDLVLRLVGRLLADNVKGRDTVARYGGEEFAILLAGADRDAAAVVAQQICTALSGKRLINKPTQNPVGQVTISIGVAQHRAGEAMGALIERADRALYLAKDLGRNRVCTELEIG